MSSKDCTHKAARAAREADPGYRCQRCKDNRKRWERKQKLSALAHYGGVCFCCGEFRHEFLAIDHVQGGGREHRKQINTPIYRWLIVNKFPLGFRVACHNCNASLGYFGYCPHAMEAVESDPIEDLPGRALPAQHH